MIFNFLKALLSKPTDLFIAVLVIIIIVLISKANCLYGETQELKLQLANQTIQEYTLSTKMMGDMITSFDEMAKQYELTRTENDTSKQISTKQFNEAVQNNPVYSHECMDGAGVFAINQAISSQASFTTTSTKH